MVLLPCLFGVGATKFRRSAEYGVMGHAEVDRDLYTSGEDTYDVFLLQSATVDTVLSATAIEPERLIDRGGPGDLLGELNLLGPLQVLSWAGQRRSSVASAPTGNVRPVATPGTHSRCTGCNPKYVQYEGLRPARREHAPDAAP